MITCRVQRGTDRKQIYRLQNSVLYGRNGLISLELQIECDMAIPKSPIVARKFPRNKIKELQIINNSLYYIDHHAKIHKIN
ncbi:Uncharacterised protein [uncultured archaeon]|nr:Uncharacterised protein [uncultured archaeon]